jgi:hypothetical protein
MVTTEIVTSSPNPSVKNGIGLTPSHRRENGFLIAASRCAAKSTLAGMRVRWYVFLGTARRNLLRLDFAPLQRRRDTPGLNPEVMAVPDLARRMTTIIELSNH